MKKGASAWRPVILGSALSLIFLLLTSCVRIVVETQAPELNKRYILTESLILTATKMHIPTFWKPLRVVPYVTTQSNFNETVKNNGSLIPEMTMRGKIKNGTIVLVKTMFLYTTPDSTVQMAELLFSNPNSKQQFSAYVNWSRIQNSLKELRR